MREEQNKDGVKRREKWSVDDIFKVHCNEYVTGEKAERLEREEKLEERFRVGSVCNSSQKGVAWPSTCSQSEGGGRRERRAGGFHQMIHGR